MLRSGVDAATLWHMVRKVPSLHWKTACKQSGLEGIIVHDLRRCAARNLSRAGVTEAVAMEITGHKTRSMYRRYRIVDERDLREATERLEGHLQEQSTTPTVIPVFITRQKQLNEC